MAVTQGSDIGTTLGQAGALASKAWEATTRSGTIAHRFALPVLIPRGNATVQLPRWGARSAAAARTEIQAAVTPTTLPTVTAPTAGRAKYGFAMGVSDEAEQITIPDNSVVERIRFELIDGNQAYIDEDSSVGIGNYRYGQLANSTGTSGAALVRSVLVTAYSQIAATTGADTVCVAHLDGVYGKKQLHNEAIQAASSMYAPGIDSQMSTELQALFAKRMFGDASQTAALANFYAFSLFGGKLHVFFSPHETELATSGSDKVGAVYVPYIPGLNGMDAGASVAAAKVQPTFNYGYRADPVIASRATMMNPTDYMQQTIKHVISSRFFNGIYQLVEDIVADATPGESYDASGRQVIYVAS